MKPILLVGNPTSQSGKNEERIREAMRLFRVRDIDVDFFPTLPEGKTIPELTKRLSESDTETVVYMGGDGTFREVGVAIFECGKSISMGMLPTGTGNDQGKSFGLESGSDALAHNIQIILNGRTGYIDIGELGVYNKVERKAKTHYFFDSAGFGMGARILSQRNKDRQFVDGLGPFKELYRDQTVYAGAMLKTLIESAFFDDEFSIDGTIDGVSHTERGLVDLVFKNTKVYGGAWVFDQRSQPDDGLFEVIEFRGKADWLARAVVDLDGNPQKDMMEAVGMDLPPVKRGARFDFCIESTEPVPAQIDGEEIESGHQFIVWAIPRAVRLIVP